jgi:hypothetical protein
MAETGLQINPNNEASQNHYSPIAAASPQTSLHIEADIAPDRCTAASLLHLHSHIVASLPRRRFIAASLPPIYLHRRITADPSPHRRCKDLIEHYYRLLTVEGLRWVPS